MTFSPDWAIMPGEIIVEMLDERGWTIKDLIDKTCVSRETIYQLLTGRISVTVELAEALGMALGTSQQIWLNLEKSWQERMTYSREKIERLQSELKAQEQATADFMHAANEEMRKGEEARSVIKKHYPTIAGHALRLQQSHEDRAASEWEAVASDFATVIGPSNAREV